jgi:hypothetical protein
MKMKIKNLWSVHYASKLFTNFSKKINTEKKNSEKDLKKNPIFKQERQEDFNVAPPNLSPHRVLSFNSLVILKNLRNLKSKNLNFFV